MDLVIPAILFAVLYAVMILPKQRQQKQHRALLASLDEGDEVLLSSGIYGFISSLDDTTLWIEVAENVELKVDRSSIADKVVGSDAGDSADDEEDE